MLPRNDGNDSHAEALADAMTQNIYTKFEVDKMIDEALARFDKRTEEMKQESEKEIHRIEKQTIEMKADNNRILVLHTTLTITILGSLMALFSFIDHLIK